MDEQRRSWLQGCAIGCGALIVIAVLFTIGGVMSVMKPLGGAIDIRAELDAQFGDQCSYQPPADGAVPADRIETFLRVRASLSEPCRVIERRSAAMRQLEELDDDAEISKTEVMALAGKATMGAMGLGPALGNLFETRNHALLAEGMGLGEYSYIYLTAYQSQLADDGPRTGIMDGSPISSRLHGCVEDMLSRQLESARSGGADPRWLMELEGELEAMASGPRRPLWGDGLPPSVLASFKPYRDQLDGVFCGAATELELLRGRRGFLAIESE